MKQINLSHDTPCASRLVMLGTLFGLAMLLIWQLAGPTPVGHVIAWGAATLAGLKLWRMIEGE
jgi:uncharacterized membrane protein YjfL (UPF0719 family)